MRIRFAPLLLGSFALASCSGVFESKMPAPQAYVLRLPPRATLPATEQPVGSVLVQRPEAGPGLDSERIALLRSGNRFDFYAASRWAAPAPDLLEDVIVDRLRTTRAFSAVFDDSAPFAPQYTLRLTLRRFEADYTQADGGPKVYVVLDCTLARHRDRELLASFSVTGSAVASEDRLNAVIAAFAAATETAVTELERTALIAVAQEPRVGALDEASKSR